MSIIAMLIFGYAYAYRYDYTFRNAPISQALLKIARDNPDREINFIYKELDKYRTSAWVNTDNVYDAVKAIIGLNPISVIRKGKSIFIEALQQGRYEYYGTIVSAGRDPIAGATVMILSLGDSTVLTYGVTDKTGRFNIPCDSRVVIGKISCIGYRTRYKRFDTFNQGDINMSELPVKLSNVTLEGANARQYSDKTVFVPTSRQKNASQSGIDLLDIMGIPQLRLSLGKSVETISGRSVAMFIDYLPASENDLAAMRMSDVKRVEFYEYPSDPRLQGNANVVNFIMAKYEYGGYVKGSGLANVITYSQRVLGNFRFQYKKMTYDLMGLGFNMNNNSHTGSSLYETYRLPQDDGEMKVFERHSDMTDSGNENQRYSLAFKATYNSDKVQASNQINARLTRNPHADRSGTVTYSTDMFPASEYSSTLATQSKYLSYRGYYFFKLPSNSSLTFNPTYEFSHTDENSSYTEKGFPTLLNGAVDNTNMLKADLKFDHDFGKYGHLLGLIRGSYQYNRTHYTGTANSLDRAKSSRIGVGATYNITAGNFYGTASFGWNWDRLQFGDMTDKPSSPWYNFSMRYAFRKNHSLYAAFNYFTWTPNSIYKSSNVIQATPLMKYTGNPNLVPSKSYDMDFNYSWYPNNNYSLSVYASCWLLADRYVFDYEATSSGVLRTIKQPLGRYSQGSYGVSGTVRLFDRNLEMTGRVGQRLNYNGTPYNVNHSYIDWSLSARYYLKNLFFSTYYSSGKGYADGFMTGIWTRVKSDYVMIVGWSNGDWNVRATLFNMFRWNWRSGLQVMNSEYYDTREQFYHPDDHALIQITATYTIGFGKKVSRSNEPSDVGSASSGILK